MTGAPRLTRALVLFERAVDLPAHERTTFLDRTCAGDPELRAEVDALLEADNSAPEFLDRPPFDLRRERDTGAGARHGIAAGTRLGAFSVVRPIGRGGMSTVYLAERADGTFEQQVAIKVLHRDLSGGEMVERFAAERRILATLRHPAIVRVVDSGTTPTGQPYLAMDYVEGERIDRWCDRQRLTVADRLRLFRQVLHAVAYAHRALVVHRDLKPDNILVTGDGQVRLLDFGIAKLLDDADDGRVVTRTGVRPMTPEYASPEQVRGERVTTACDIYALGVLLYELLTGRRPYDPDATTPASVEKAILESEPERPSRVVGRTAGATTGSTDTGTPESLAAARRTEPVRLRSLLNGDLDAIVLKALRKEPEARYGSADALAEDIDRYLGSLPVRARRGSRAYHVRKFVRRHRAGVALAGAVLLLLAGSVAAIERSRATAQEARRAAEREARTAREATEFLVALFRGSDPFENAGDTLTAAALLHAGRARIADELRDEPIVRAELLLALGRVYSNLGRFETADTLLHEALVTREAAAPGPDGALAGLYEALGDNYDASRDFPSAVEYYRRALETGDARPGPARAALLAAFAGAQAFAGFPDSALARIHEALAIDAARGDSSSAGHLARRVRLAGILRHSGDLEGAARIYDDLLGRLPAAPDPDTYTYATVLNNAAYLQTRLGRWDRAIPLYKRGLELARAIVGGEHPRAQMFLANLASAQFHSGAHDEAVASLTEELDLARRTWPDGHWRLGSSYAGLGRLLLRAGRYEEAETTLRSAVATYRESLGADHSWTVRSEAWRAMARIELGRPDALVALDRTVDVLAGQSLDRNERDDVGRLADVLEARGDTVRARRFRGLAGSEEP